MTQPPRDQVLRVLLAERSDSAAHVIRGALRSGPLPCELERSATAAAALAAVQASEPPFDLLLIDHDLPDVPGDEVCSRLLATHPTTPSVLLVAPGEERVAAEALEAGVAAYLVMDPHEGYATLLPAVLSTAVRHLKDHPSGNGAGRVVATGDGVHDLLCETAPLLLYTTNREGRLTSVSDHWLAVLGYDRDAVLGRPATAFLTEASRRIAEEVAVPHLGEAGIARDVPYQFVRGDGSTLDVLVSAVADRDADGAVGQVTALMVDVTPAAPAAPDDGRITDQQYRLLMEHAAEGIILADQAGHFLGANTAGCTMLGYTEEEMRRLNFRDLLSEEDIAAQPIRIPEIVAGATVVQERRMRRKDGSWLCVEITASILDDGRIQGVVRDLTDERQAQADVAQSRSELRATLDSTADGILMVDATGKITNFNRRFVEMWHIPESIMAAGDDEQALASVLEQLVDPEAFLAKVRELYANPDARSFDILEFKDGRVFERTSVPQQPGEAAGRVWTFRDVTDARRALADQQRAEARLRTVASSLPIILFATDAEGICTFVEGRALRAVGFDPEQLVGVSVFAELTNVPLFAELDEAPQIEEHLRRALAGEEVTATAAFRDRVFEARYAPMRDAHGAIQGVIGVATDVTARSRAEQERRQAEERLGTVVANAPVVLFALDRDGRFTLSEGLGLHALGLQPGEIVGRSLAEVYGDLPAVQELLHRGLAGEEIVQALRVGDLEYDLRLTPLRDEAGAVDGLIGVAVDHTEQSRAERALRESEERYRALVESAPLGIIACDPSGAILAVNERLVQMLGAPSVEAVLAVNLLEVSGLVESGAIGWAVNSLEQGRRVSREVQYTTQWGKELHALVHVALMRDGDGQVTGAQAIVQDITERLEAERALRESEQRYRRLADQVRDTIWTADPSGCFTYVSPSIERFTEFAPYELVGRPFDCIVHPDSLDYATRLFAEAMAGTIEEILFEACLITKSGATRPCEINCTVVRNAEGALEAVHGVTRDISERVRAEDALRESEERYRTLAERAQDMIWITGADGRLTYVSPAITRILGFAPEDAMGMHYLTGVVTEEASTPVDALTARIEAGELDEFLLEVPFVGRDGSPVWCEVAAGVVRDADGQWIALQGVTRDISERKAAEEQLRESEARYRLLADHAQDMIWATDAEGRLTYVSPSVERILGFTPEESLGGHFLASTVEDAANVPVDALVAQVQEGMRDAWRLEVPLRHKDGTPVWCEVTAAVIRDEAGRVEARQGVARDISERKEAEAHLRESEARYRLLADNAQDIIWAFDGDGRYTYVSPSVERIIGYSPAELMGESFEIGLAPQAVDTVRRFLASREANERREARFEAQLLAKDGREVWCEINAVVVTDAAGKPTAIQGVTRDISERKAAEAALQESEARYRLLADQARDVIWTMDVGGQFTYVSPAAKAIFGYEPDEMVGRFLTDHILTPEAEADALAWGARAVAGEIDEFLYEGEHYTAGDATVWCEVSVAVLRDDAGRVRAFMGATRDISDRKQAEEERRHLEAQMQHTQKLESLGVLAGGIAHDFNNLLVGVLGNAGLALMDLPPESAARPRVERIETAAQRAADLTTQMLAYSGKGKFVVQPLNLSTVVHEMGHLLETVISKKAVLRFDFASDLPAVEGDATQLRQVIMNLITNASDALEDMTGTITVRTFVADVDHTELAQTYLEHELPEGPYVHLEVTDTGSGMDADTRARIFDPFFSTKFTGRGLGLAAVLGIVRGHEGTLRVHSVADAGSTFTVLLPASDAPARPLPGEAATDETWEAGGTVLVVDDEEGVRSVAQAVLEQAGFRVLTAYDGMHGVDVFRRNEPDIDLVLLDLTMPRMNGEEALREMRQLRRGVRVLLTSGYTEQEATNHFLEEGLAGFIHKPYRPRDLLQKIREVLQH